MSTVECAISSTFDRSLHWHQGNSVRYLVVRLCARHTIQKHRERMPLNLALAIDASGSMGGGKLNAAKEAALGIVERLNELDHLSIVSFSSDVVTHIRALTTSPSNLEQLRNEIRAIGTRGMTNLSAGWFEAVDAAEDARDRQRELPTRVVILSDGLANQGITDRARLARCASELRERGVTTSALGIGDGYDEDLLRRITEHGGGRLHDAENADEISTVLLGELDEMFGTVLDDVCVGIELPAGFSAEPVGPSTFQSDTRRLTVRLGSLLDGVERSVVIRVRCPGLPVGKMSSFRLKVTGTANDGPVAAEASAWLEAAEGARNTTQLREIGAALTVAKMWAADILGKVTDLNRDGAYGEARQLAAREFNHFRKYASGIPEARKLVDQIGLIAERAHEEFSPRMRKELYFSATTTLEQRPDHRGPRTSWSSRFFGRD